MITTLFVRLWWILLKLHRYLDFMTKKPLFDDWEMNYSFLWYKNSSVWYKCIWFSEWIPYIFTELPLFKSSKLSLRWVRSCGVIEMWLPTCLPALSHTWVRYPGFWGHGVKCPILTTVVPGFPAIWLAVPFGANGAHLGICTLPEKNIFCVWNKLFLGEIKFSQSRTRPVKSLWWQIVPMQESTNEWKNLTIF